MILENDISAIRGIGSERRKILTEQCGIKSLEDLIYYRPRRYIDRSQISNIFELSFNNDSKKTFIAKVNNTVIAGQKRKFLKVVVSDNSGSIDLIFFHNISFFRKLFTPESEFLFYGKIDFFNNSPQITHPEFDQINDESTSLHLGRIVPIYPLNNALRDAGISSRLIRKYIHQVISECLSEIQDPLPRELLREIELPDLQWSLRNLHFPDSLETAEKARQRLAFDEVFYVQYYLQLLKLKSRAKREIHKTQGNTLNKFITNLPFELTSAQQQSLNEIITDMSAPYPMNRLLQGDVGSGKTVVALAAAMHCADIGKQTALLAPTEALALQHYQSCQNLMPVEFETAILTGSTKIAQRKSILQNLISGKTGLIIGTHALLQDDVEFNDLGLVIIDEQHRFGVEQRATMHKKGKNPDLLVMTATPIPRSLTLALFGDLDLSIMNQKPANRKPVKTMLFSEERIDAVCNSVRKYCSQGQQAYFVLPIIDDSGKPDLKSATIFFQELKEHKLVEFNIGLLHGRQTPAEKKKVLEDFYAGIVQILVSTTVIEVGIDVPNATIMVIIHAERFGLSQLHQLRGRVGRSNIDSFCALIHSDKTNVNTIERLKLFCELDSGFDIAEADLATRGSGDFFGIRQHGLPDFFEYTDLSTDADLIEKARNAAISAVHNQAIFTDVDVDKIKHSLSNLRHSTLLSIIT